MKQSPLDKLEKRFGHFAIPHLSLIIIIGQLICLALSMFAGVGIENFAYNAPAVFKGEIWRLFSFLFTQPLTWLPLMAFSLYFFYIMGNALEEEWGTFKYNLFLLIGWGSVIATGLIFPNSLAFNFYIITSVVIAFCYLNPDFEFLLMLIIPMKCKWLLWITIAFQLYEFITLPFFLSIYILPSYLSLAIFIGPRIVENIKTRKRREAYHKELKAAGDEPFHQCADCKITDITHPRMDFRYRDEKEYCAKCLSKLKQENP